MNIAWPELLILVGISAAAEGASLWALLHWRPRALVTRNYRQTEVVSRGGLTFAAPLVVAALAAGLLGAKGDAALVTVVATGLSGLLGWLDDAWGTPGVRGLKGHFARLIGHREVTTGLVKAVGGAGIGLWAAHMLGAEGWRLIPAGAVVALCANTVNALDARPGRALKLFLGAAVVILAFTGGQPMAGAVGILAALMGAAIVFAPADLRERAMLGDTGANPLGAALGISVVRLTRWPAWVVLAGVLLAFCLAADRWSLTAAMEHTPGLRWLDRLGRRDIA